MTGKREEKISWQAQEYIPHNKNALWYVVLMMLGLGTVVLLVWLQEWIFMVLVIVSVIGLLVYAVRPPRVLEYSLDKTGLMEGKRLYRYEEFKAFGILEDEGYYSITLIPRKRFAPIVMVFFPKERGEKIVDAFGIRLPMENVKLDFLDKIVKFLRI